MPEKRLTLNTEKRKAIGLKKKGMAGTILTSGQGLEDEASVGKSVLGSKY